MQKSLRCKDSRLGFGLLILFGISLVILNFGITRLSALQEPEKDSEIRAALSSLNWPDWLKPGSLRICFLRTWWVSSIMTTAGHLRRSLTRWTDWGMVWNGNVLTAKISASPSQETACTLSDIQNGSSFSQTFVSGFLMHCLIQVVLNDNELFYAVRNRSLPVDVSSDRLPVTTKENPPFHGYGLQNVQTTLAKYHSVYAMDYADGWFEFATDLPNTLIS